MDVEVKVGDKVSTVVQLDNVKAGELSRSVSVTLKNNSKVGNAGASIWCKAMPNTIFRTPGISQLIQYDVTDLVVTPGFHIPVQFNPNDSKNWEVQVNPPMEREKGKELQRKFEFECWFINDSESNHAWAFQEIEITVKYTVQ